MGAWGDSKSSILGNKGNNRLTHCSGVTESIGNLVFVS